MDTNTPTRSFPVTKRSIDFNSSQSRVTQFFKPDPEKVSEHAGEKRSLLNDSTNKKDVSLQPAHQEAKTSPRKITEVIVDSTSSDQESEIEPNGSSPRKKARVVKKALFSVKNSIPKEFDPLLRKPGLVMRNNCTTQAPNRQALEEKKNVNSENAKLGKRRILINSISDPICGDTAGESNAIHHKNFKLTQSRNDTHCTTSEDGKNKTSGGSNKSNTVSNYFQTKTTSLAKTKRHSDSEESLLNLDLLNHYEEKSKPSKKIKTQRQIRKSPEADSTPLEQNLGRKKRNASPDPSICAGILMERSISRPDLINSSSEKRQKIAVGLSDVDGVHLESTSNLRNTSSLEKTNNSENQLKHRRIVRRSLNTPKDGEKLSICPKIVVGSEEISAAAAVAFRQTYRDIETLLDMNLDIRTSPDFKWCMTNSKCALPNRFHVNFRFFMKRGESGDHNGALSSLRAVNYRYYPNAQDLHTTIHQVLMRSKEHVVLHRAQELVYRVLGLHPPVDDVMRQYYWSVMSQHFDDIEPASRWENLRYLLEKILNDDSQDTKNINTDTEKMPTKLECRRAVLGFLVNLLREDLRCWINLTERPSSSLRRRADLPLIARVLWPQSSIPHVNGACRELIQFHVAALKSGKDYHTCFTAPLVKMMAAVTQLVEFRLPLKIRKPSPHMLNLAREIVLHSECLIDSQNSFYYSFGSPELSLLLSLTVLNRQKPQVSIPEGRTLSLKWLINAFFELDVNTKEEEVRARSLLQPTVERNAFVVALATYSRLYCAFETWFYLRLKFRKPTTLPNYGQPQVPLKEPTSVLFSSTFSADDLVDDLRQTKYLLDVNKNSGDRSVYSYLCWS